MGSALIFGISGQDGFYLKSLLEKSGFEVYGYARDGGDGLLNREFVEREVIRLRPDFIFHFAAVSSTRHDFVFENHAVISGGTLNILEAVHRHSPATKVFITGSGVQFRNQGLPISEEDAFEASSPYSVSRIHSVYAARYYRRLGVQVYVGYLFHHESPLRKAGHLTKKIADFVRRTNKNSDERIVIGDVSVRKEYGFAGDIVNGIWTLVSQNEVFEAVIGTGIAYSVADWLDVCFAKCGLDWHDFVELKKDGFVPEYSVLVSNPKTINDLGWQPNASLEDLAEMMLR